MTFEPQTIETTDLLSTGASKINDNFEAIAEEFENITIEGVSDIVGAMVSGNTETGITVSYQDSDNTLDFVVSYGTEPPAVSSSTSGTAGNSNSVSRANHSHDLGTHTHADATTGGTIAHTALTSIGTNTHAQIDTFISSKAGASGLASLNASSLVVQNPANATATPMASKIPIADGSAKLDGWVSGTIGTPSATNPLVTNDDYEALSIEIVADALDINYIPDGYTPEATPGTAAIYQLVGHLKGISDKLAELESRIAALE